MKVLSGKISVIREPLLRPFGFKGGRLTELWQVVCNVASERSRGVGVGVQSVLWADENVFAAYSEQDGNALMKSVTDYAFSRVIGVSGDTPVEIMDEIFPFVMQYANTLYSGVRETFVRNALVCLDNALWSLYAHERGETDILKLLPQKYALPLSGKQDKLINVPLISYGVPDEEILRLVESGSALLKIKIGDDDGGKRSKEEMLKVDCARVKRIHELVSGYTTPYTKSGKVLYYLDANQRYDSVERVSALIDFMKREDILDRVALLEEPFSESAEIDVGGLPVTVVGDESVHSLADVAKRVKLGYKAIALKPIAKTLSETLKIIAAANDYGISCFCADLTVNPLMVEWNKNIAARIAPLAQMTVGVVESNGEQNYLNWRQMQSYSPSFGKPYAALKDGVYNLDSEFYRDSGAIFATAKYYEEL